MVASRTPTAGESGELAGPQPGQMFDLYANLFSEESSREPETGGQSSKPAAAQPSACMPAIPPRAPVTLQDTGLHRGNCAIRS